jgi:uncharacterized cupin superfamily protein
MTGSFVVNVADAVARDHPDAGVSILLEESGGRGFRDTGISVKVLRPGQPSCKYHAENVQEDFLVLAGECVAILDGEERTLRAWDFLHCDPGAAHAFVGAGDGPCWLLAIGARRDGMALDFPVDERAARHGASAPARTSDGDEAYADWPGGPPPGHAPRVVAPWPPR